MRAGIIIASDSAYSGSRADLSGPAADELLRESGYETLPVVVVPDERGKISEAIVRLCDDLGADLVVTSGGTGFAARDVTPEATEDVIDRKVPGIPEAIRAASMRITDRAMLSRGTAGIRGGTLIVNLPGSPKAVRESLAVILPAVAHGLEVLRGEARECAGDRKGE